MSAIEPLAKRQRKEPSWRAGFVDPDLLKDSMLVADGDPAQQLLAMQQLAQQQGNGQGQRQQQQGPSSSGPSSSGPSDAESDPENDEDPPQVLEVRPLDAHRVEVVVERDGRRYRGVMEREGLPPGVGVPIPITPEELASMTAAAGHGENSSSLCALCNTKLNCTPVVGMSDDKVGVYVKVRVTANWTARVHLQCAVWCPEAVEDPFHLGYYHHMGTAVRRGRQLRCHVCKERGATVGCFQEGCPSVYHLTCAVNAGCHFDEERQEVWCPAHVG